MLYIVTFGSLTWQAISYVFPLNSTTLKLAKLSINDIFSRFTCITYINLQLQITMVIYYTFKLKDQMSDRLK